MTGPLPAEHLIPILDIQNLSISYDRKNVIQMFSKTLTQGCYALCGRNGSGKTTLLQAVSGIKAPAGGVIYIDGVDLYREPVRAKALLSYMPDKPYVYSFMTGRDLLNLIAYAKNTELDSKLFETIEVMGAKGFTDFKFGDMSLGTQRKYTFFAALIGSPRLLVLDEPSNGLDKTSCVEMVKILRHYSAKNVVLLSSHDAVLIQQLDAEIINLDK